MIVISRDLHEMSEIQIQSGALVGRTIQRVYTTQHGKVVYKIFNDGLGFGPGFSLKRGFLGFGWRWEGWSHENVAMMRINIKGFSWFQKQAIGAATEETIRIWEEWESGYERTGRKVIAP